MAYLSSLYTLIGRQLDCQVNERGCNVDGLLTSAGIITANAKRGKVADLGAECQRLMIIVIGFPDSDGRSIIETPQQICHGFFESGVKQCGYELI